MSALTKTFTILTLIVAIGVGYFYQTHPSIPILDKKSMDELYKQAISSQNIPINEKTGRPLAIVTGATSGVGYALTEELLKRGVDVIIASRSLKKCQQIADKLNQELHSTTSDADTDSDSDSTKKQQIGNAIPAELNVGDLKSVQKFIEWFYSSNYESLSLLVNNAGGHYMTNDNTRAEGHLTFENPQGYDELFATNYLGHWLLTKSLLPALKLSGKGRILSTASGFHYQPTDFLLRPQRSLDNLNSTVDSIDFLTAPLAANGKLRDLNHRMAMYGVTKLAQVLHMNELQRRFDLEENQLNEPKERTTVEALSFCPGWVATSIIPNSPVGNVIRRIAFTPSASVLAPLTLLASPKREGSMFVSNYIMPLTQSEWGQSLLYYATKFGLRAPIVNILGMVMMFTQSRSYSYQYVLTSEYSRDAQLAKELYDWTEKELEARGF